VIYLQQGLICSVCGVHRRRCSRPSPVQQPRRTIHARHLEPWRVSTMWSSSARAALSHGVWPNKRLDKAATGLRGRPRGHQTPGREVYPVVVSDLETSQLPARGPALPT
jgi:hypothetical protein